MATKPQSEFLKHFGSWVKAQAGNFPEKAGRLLEAVLPKVSQPEIDALHAKVSQPVHDAQAQWHRLSSVYPLLASLKLEEALWILQQAGNVLHLTASLFHHSEVSHASKGKLGMALVYFISPIDVLPEGLIGPIGYVDDVMVATWVIDSILHGQNEREKALINTLWRGTAEDLEKLRRLTRIFDVMKVVRAIGRGGGMP